MALATIGTAAFTVAKWLLGADGVIGKGFDLASKRADVDLRKTEVLTGAQKEVLIEALRGDSARLQVQGNLVLQAMTHKIWWVAWAVFVLPVGVYEAAIFLASTFDVWLNTPGCYIPKIGEGLRAGLRVCEVYVRRVPEEQEKLAAQITGTIFIAQASTGVAAGIYQSITRIFEKK